MKHPLDDVKQQIYDIQKFHNEFSKMKSQLLDLHTETLKSFNKNYLQMITQAAKTITEANQIYFSQIKEINDLFESIQPSINTQIAYQLNLTSKEILKEFSKSFNYSNEEVFKAHNLLVQKSLKSTRPIAIEKTINSSNPVRDENSDDRWDDVPEIFKQRINTPFLSFVNKASIVSMGVTLEDFINKILNDEKISSDPHFTILLISLILFIASYNNENQNH